LHSFSFSALESCSVYLQKMVFMLRVLESLLDGEVAFSCP